MKTFSFFMAVLFVAGVAQAELDSLPGAAQNQCQTFSGSGCWTGSNMNETWTAPLAAKMSAVDDAIEACRATGMYRFCLYMSTYQGKLNYQESRGEAIIRGTNQGQINGRYSEEVTLEGQDISNKPMTQQAAKMSALEQAAYKCFAAGNDGCAIVSAKVKETNYYKVIAEATVIGVKY